MGERIITPFTKGRLSDSLVCVPVIDTQGDGVTLGFGSLGLSRAVFDVLIFDVGTWCFDCFVVIKHRWF